MGVLFHIIICYVLYQNLLTASGKLSEREIVEFRNDVVEMFYHAYDGYMAHAYPLDELRPLTCNGHDTWGSYSLTLIDALDTLAVLGNKTEFQRVVYLITDRQDFDVDINVSVFETNIRIVGGLLSGHLLSRKMGLMVDREWPCKGPLLSLAKDVATRLLPAFNTATGMPYGTVNLRHGVPEGETPVTCTAGVGTFVMEFGTLSRLTGDPIFGEVSLRALHTLWSKRSSLGLLGNHIDITTGSWTAQDSGIGAGVDSFFEYLLKGGFHLQRPELVAIFNEAKTTIDKYLRHDDWHLWVSMMRGHVTMAVFQSLEAFWPGMLAMSGDVTAAQKSLFNYHQVWKQHGFTPEFYNIAQGGPSVNREGYPLRPELAESIMYVYQATDDPVFLEMGADIVTSIKHSAKTSCGYATINNVLDHSLDNRMESFFLAETTKYLYLLFTPDHWIFNKKMTGKLRRVGDRPCVVEAAYFFNTEAHPMDTGALACCYPPEEDVYDPFITDREWKAKLRSIRESKLNDRARFRIKDKEKLGQKVVTVGVDPLVLSKMGNGSSANVSLDSGSVANGMKEEMTTKNATIKSNIDEILRSESRGTEKEEKIVNSGATSSGIANPLLEEEVQPSKGQGSGTATPIDGLSTNHQNSSETFKEDNTNKSESDQFSDKKPSPPKFIEKPFSMKELRKSVDSFFKTYDSDFYESPETLSCPAPNFGHQLVFKGQMQTNPG